MYATGTKNSTMENMEYVEDKERYKMQPGASIFSSVFNSRGCHGAYLVKEKNCYLLLLHCRHGEKVLKWDEGYYSIRGSILGNKEEDLK